MPFGLNLRSFPLHAGEMDFIILFTLYRSHVDVKRTSHQSACDGSLIAPVTANPRLAAQRLLLGAMRFRSVAELTISGDRTQYRKPSSLCPAAVTLHGVKKYFPTQDVFKENLDPVRLGLLIDHAPD